MSVPVSPTPTPRRLRSCVDSWPDCFEGGYDPGCCRFPKSCSCTVYDPERVTDADLETPVSSPTPDEQAAEGPCGCICHASEQRCSDCVECDHHMIGADLPMQDHPKFRKYLTEDERAMLRPKVPEPNWALAATVDDELGQRAIEQMRDRRWSDAMQQALDPARYYLHDQMAPLVALADSESADLRAALVVVREQLTQAQAKLDAIRDLHRPCPPRTQQQIRRLKRQGLWEGWQPWCMECSDDYPVTWPCPTFQAVLSAPPSPPTYTTEEGQKP